MVLDSQDGRIVSLRRIEELLSSSFLQLGDDSIRDCGREVISRDILRVFAAHKESLAAHCVELVVLGLRLDDGAEEINDIPSREAITFLTNKARELNASTIWYISPYIIDETVITNADHRIRLIGPERLFREIVDLPDDMLRFWMREAFDVETATFAIRYQRRAAAALDDLPRHRFGRVYEPFDSELAQWAMTSVSEAPVLLLGDRGSGKTWQLLKFCEEQQSRHHRAPWIYPPAIYLSLRGVGKHLAHGRASSLGLYALLAQRYSWFSVKWDVRMLQSLLESGQLIMCLDGLDEFGADAPDEGVRDHLHRVIELLPRGSHFILSCRSTHFASFAELASLETWAGSTVSGTMRVLQMLPFRRRDPQNYLEAAMRGNLQSPAAQRLRGLLSESTSIDLASVALRRCAREPAILSRLVAELAAQPEATNLHLLKTALEDSLIAFNLEAERTRPLHLDQKGEVVTFGTTERIEFLGELAWFMAERALHSIDLEKIPKRIAIMFGMGSKALERDIRSQTVFELDQINPVSDCDQPYGLANDSPSCKVRFGLQLEDADDSLGGDPISDGHLLDQSKHRSVAHSYFLASHLARHLGDQLNIPGVRVEDALQYLGRVELDPLTAAIVRAHLDSGCVRGYNVDSLGSDVRALIGRLATQGKCRVFDRSFRYLVSNAVMVGCFAPDDGARLDPWTMAVAAVVQPPALLPEYQLVLVPARISSKLNGPISDTFPFVIGLHEVTNEHFDRFIQSDKGKDWSVERVRRSLSGAREPRSPKAKLTNEYHLYFWVEDRSLGARRFVPPSEYREHPVVYVSRYAAEAFCNWLSDAPRGTTKSPKTRSLTAYRLPTMEEWGWAAQGAFAHAQYPWDLLPYPVISNASGSSSGAPTASSTETAASDWFMRYRRAAKEVLLDTGKRSSQVAYDDEYSPFGVAGLIGNVKEWVQGAVSTGEAAQEHTKGIVCGGTAHLGHESFLFGYAVRLYPENTNPDVGFRIARSLSDSELEILRSREETLARL